MSISFYEASVDTYQRVLGSVAGIMDKGAAYAADSGLDLQEIVTTKLRDDMMPFHFQIVSVCHHSWGALQGMREGRFTPPSFDLDEDYQGLQALVAETAGSLITGEATSGSAARLADVPRPIMAVNAATNALP